MSFSPALLIPHYDHLDQFRRVLPELLELELPMILVDDGSPPAVVAALAKEVERIPLVSLHQHPENRGKGAAVQTGLAAARALGHTHCIQVDADGQHNLEDIPALVRAAQDHPDAIISGWPQFSDDMPKARKFGRQFTHFWTRLETLSGHLRDAMCGFRVYPIDLTLALADRYGPRPRMEFDTEILVFADWSGGLVRYVRTPVRYPEDGKSHFHYLKDNWDITRMHTRLVLRMLPRMPLLLYRNLRRGFRALPVLESNR